MLFSGVQTENQNIKNVKEPSLKNCEVIQQYLNACLHRKTEHKKEKTDEAITK